jgi:hypothetical protein
MSNGAPDPYKEVMTRESLAAMIYSLCDDVHRRGDEWENRTALQRTTGVRLPGASRTCLVRTGTAAKRCRQTATGPTSHGHSARPSSTSSRGTVPLPCPIDR